MDEPACRICLETTGPFISPCLCKGSMKFIHQDCIEKWRNTSPNPLSYSRCEQCQYTYKFTSPNLIHSIILYICTCLLLGYGLNVIIDAQGYHVMLEPFPMGFLSLSVLGLLRNPLLYSILFTLIMDDDISYQFIHIILTIGTYYSFMYIHRFRKKEMLSIQT